MKILVVGGTGMIGGHIARLLEQRGDHVTVSARGEVAEDSLVAGLPQLKGDYTAGTFTEAELAPYDAVVFAAGQDFRHLPRDLDVTDAAALADYWERVQSSGVPAFAELCKRAGVGRFVQVGSYYHQVLPRLCDGNVYVDARRLADERTRALSDASFAAITLNPPNIVGAIPGIALYRFAKIVRWADGELPDVPDFAPAGGTNYMSVRSLSEAVAGAVAAGEPGKAYLIGDENLTFAEYFQMVFEAAGSDRTVEERDESHPFLPDAMIVPGRGYVLSYEPDPAETTVLGYTRQDVRRELESMVERVRALPPRPARGN
ncbi:NAD-dependent epimerase/dehydratase family protein [Nocardioides sambongensis]|uniref:NAD-dependent epimerase/dehydratase family protein n=1 Tax=Nocardioides sambongensis TaxID=2589074 RepID=UPI00112E87AF|nr:NAD(P)-dependent oxidoreductase [Nocardioides sambongensis]